MQRIEVNGLVYEFEDDMSLMLLLDENANRVYEGIVTEEAPPNAPLTLEELREMDGEPVWVEHCNGGEWVVVAWNIHDEIAGARQARLDADNYGSDGLGGWLAYRRKPEEGMP